jgi:hypothetical protein
MRPQSVGIDPHGILVVSFFREFRILEAMGMT